MRKKDWKRKIKSQCEAVGMFKESFLPVIDTLAAILEQRDNTYNEFIDSGGRSCIEHVAKNGAVNMTKNPLLVLWDELNKSALAYWRDLGLTPAGLKKIDDTAMKKEKKSGLAEILKELGS